MPVSLKEVSRLKRKLRAAAYTAGGMDVRQLFRRLDRRNTGQLRYSEFATAVKRVISLHDASKRKSAQASEGFSTPNRFSSSEVPKLGASEMEYVLKELDPDRTGSITERSFLAFLKPPSIEQLQMARELSSARQYESERDFRGDRTRDVPNLARSWSWAGVRYGTDAGSEGMPDPVRTSNAEWEDYYAENPVVGLTPSQVRQIRELLVSTRSLYESFSKICRTQWRQ